MARLGLLPLALLAVSALCAGATGATDSAGVLERANAAFQKKDFREAVQLYTDALQSDPKESTYYLRASALEGARDYEGAIDDYKQVLELATAGANSTYARKTRRRLQDLCVSTCGTYCLKVLPRDALTKEKTDDCRSLAKKAKNAASLGAEELADLAKRCPHNAAVLKASLRNAIRTNSYKDVRSSLERLKAFSGSRKADGRDGRDGSEVIPSASSLNRVSAIYEYLSLIESGDIRSLLARAKRAVASDPDDTLSGNALKMAKSLAQGQTLFQNSTVSTAPSHDTLASFISQVERGAESAGRFANKAEEVTAELMKSLYPELRRYENAKAVVNFGKALDQVQGALSIMGCVAAVYDKNSAADKCGAFFERLNGVDGGGAPPSGGSSASGASGQDGASDGAYTPSLSGFKANPLNSYFIALYHTLQANGCVRELHNAKRKGEDIEDDVAACEKLLNRARAAFSEGRQQGGEEKSGEASSPLEKDINRISDRIFEYQKALLVPDFYKVLGVTKATPLNEIRKKYYRLAKEYHPDYTPADATEEEKKLRERRFQKIAEAWDVLSDPEKKKQYDSGMYMQEELAQREAAHQQSKMSAQQQQQARRGPFQQFQEFNFGGNGGGYRRIVFQQGGDGAGGGNFNFFNNDFFRQFGFV